MGKLPETPVTMGKFNSDKNIRDFTLLGRGTNGLLRTIHG